MPSQEKVRAWTVDQIEKSQFFHQKLHEWGLLELAQEIEGINGENFEWDLNRLGIDASSWNRVIHRGIKPVRVFCHPDILVENPRRVAYYRMLAMVSQKSMSQVGLPTANYEAGRRALDSETALRISRHLNRIISILVNYDERLDEREFDLWRGMTAGSQAQGAWQNIKGDKAEALIKDLVLSRLRERGLLRGGNPRRRSGEFFLIDGRKVVMSRDPDIGIYRDGVPIAAVEIKGGIDTAGIHERFGAALKSLVRVKHANPDATTILLAYGVSLTDSVPSELEDNKGVVDGFFAIEEMLKNDDVRKQFFEMLNI